MIKPFFGISWSPASGYYRMLSFAEEAKKQGLMEYLNSYFDPTEHFYFENSFNDPKKRQKALEELDIINKSVDVFILQTLKTTAGLAVCDIIKNVYKKPLITEIDDYCLALNADHPSVKYFSPNGEIVKVILQQIKMSDAVIVSTHQLAEMYKGYNKNIFVIPNSIDFKDRWNLKNNNVEQRKDDIIRIGWEGGSGHLRDLKVIQDVIPVIQERYKNVRFYFMGGEIPEGIKNVTQIKGFVGVREYPKAKAEIGFDIELAPLRDDLFNRSKSNLRYLEASALLIPCVSSNVGPYRENHGLLAETSDQWIEHISKLVENAEYRKETAKDQYKYVKGMFNMEDTAKRYVEILERIKENVNVNSSK